MANPNRRGPRALSELLGELFTVRGYGRLRALSELEEVWNTAVGEPHCQQTRVGEVRRGVLNVTVAHPTLLEELAAFRKPELLQALRTGASGTSIHDIRFRVGPIEDAEPTKTESLPPPSSAILPPRRSTKLSPGAAGKRRRSRGRSDDRDRTAGDD
jgi:predicted nucleic acid-binding Zn ribbon protein